MGSYPTGAETTKEIEKIELSSLIKSGLLIKDKTTSGIIAWSNGNTVSITSTYNNHEAFVKLSYNIVSSSKKQEYNIQLAKVPSNLGIGEVLYFICPETGKKCRVLYKTYGSKIWKSRLAYKQRIYYKSQISSGFWTYFDRYEETQKQLAKLRGNIKKEHYKQRLTVPRKRELYLQGRIIYYQKKMDELKQQYCKSPTDLTLLQDLLFELKAKYQLQA